ncbi:MAG TPA: ribosome small subunit-dependent GTPase A [Gemmatimonadaceae bacterium]|nr:ribosome small subunit-dependent GTPase A [Gemmatimonadaceae bacterium]
MSDGAMLDGVVLGGTGGVWRVRAASGEVVEATLRGRLKIDNTNIVKLAVGDDVRLERPVRGEGWAIAEIRPRRSKLARRAPGGGQGERIVAANVDQVVVMFAAARPEPHPRMLDRFLVIAEGNGLPARIVVNKIDLVGEAAAREIFDGYAAVGYPVHYTSVKTGDGVEQMHDALAGRRSVVTGPSGVGKSSLLNALFPGAQLRVGAISESVNKGRHTTVGAHMLPLPGDEGGYVIDTPGLREVGLWALPAEELDRCFPEIRAVRDECRFADCRHLAEPDCAVRAAVHDGGITEARYDSYLRLLEELEEK